jgi:hypothetical protein
MRLDQLLPVEWAKPEILAALRQGNPVLALTIATESLEEIGTWEEGNTQAVLLLMQAAIAARGSAQPEEAAAWAHEACMTARGCQPEIEVAAAACGLLTDADCPSKAEVIAKVQAWLSGSSEKNPLVTMLAESALLHVYVLEHDWAQAAQLLGQVNSAYLARPYGVELQTHVYKAIVSLRGGDAAQAQGIVELLEPLAIRLSGEPGMSGIWWEVAEIYFAMSLESRAWTAAGRAIDMAGLRPADGDNTLSPGLLAWETVL